MCRQNQQQQHSGQQQLNLVREYQEKDSDDSIYHVEYIGTLQQNNDKKFFVPLHIMDQAGDTVIDCQLDTGATYNVMSFNDVCDIKQHGDPQLTATTAKLKLYDNSVLSILGECDLTCEYKSKRYQLNFKVISGSQKLLLSGKTCNKMGLITINEVHQMTTPAGEQDLLLCEYRDVFQGLGCLPGVLRLTQQCQLYSMLHDGHQLPLEQS